MRNAPKAVLDHISAAPECFASSPRRLVTAALLVAGFGCASPTELCACVYPPRPALHIQGTVTRAGQPAANVFVREETVAGSCQFADSSGIPASLNVMGRAAQVDARGRYTLEVRIVDASQHVCVRLTAYALPGPMAQPEALANAERTGLRLRDSRLGGPALDTIRVDFALPR